VRACTAQLAHVVRDRQIQEQIFERAELQIVPVDPRRGDRLRGTAVDPTVAPRGADLRQQLAHPSGFDRRAGVTFTHAGVPPQPGLCRRRTIRRADPTLVTRPCESRPLGFETVDLRGQLEQRVSRLQIRQRRRVDRDGLVHRGTQRRTIQHCNHAETSLRAIDQQMWVVRLR